MDNKHRVTYVLCSKWGSIHYLFCVAIQMYSIVYSCMQWLRKCRSVRYIQYAWVYSTLQIWHTGLSAVNGHLLSIQCSFNPCIITLRPRQHGRHFADDTFKRIFLNENVIISIKISLKFVPKGPIYNIPALVQTMAWRRSGDKPLSEPMMVSSLTHICVTRPQWVKQMA